MGLIKFIFIQLDLHFIMFFEIQKFKILYSTPFAKDFDMNKL